MEHEGGGGIGGIRTVPIGLKGKPKELEIHERIKPIQTSLRLARFTET